jgi:DNA-binding CsgD family transcriptional regulator
MPSLITPSARAASLQAFLAGPTTRSDRGLADLIARADALENTTLVIYDYAGKTALHVGEGMTGLCGYTPSTVCKGGAAFFLKITAPSDLPYLQLLQSGYLQEARSPGFNPRSLRFHDYYWTIIGKDDMPVGIASTGVVLTYTPQGELGTGIGFHTRHDRNSDETMISCKELLQQIKLRHNEVYQHPERRNMSGLAPSNYINATADLITPREREVLGLMAQGHTTTSISDTLRIAANTVESHRKKLLSKFEARNTAQLIMKASKVFWLT